MRKTPPTNSINGPTSKCHSGALFCLAPACYSLGLLFPGPVVSGKSSNLIEDNKV